MTGRSLRVAITSRHLATGSPTGSAASTVAAAKALALAGNDVWLLSEGLAAPWADIVRDVDGLSWRTVSPERGGHFYFSQALSYADRVYDTVSALHHEAPLDVVDMPDTTGEAFTILRARRLLGAFPRTVLAVSEQPWDSERASAEEPTHLPSEVAAYTDAYARTHADLLLAVRSVQGGPVSARRSRQATVVPGAECVESLLEDRRPDLARIDEAAPAVMWLGPLRAGAGLDTFLAAVDTVAAAAPGLRVLVRGPDTNTDPLGRSFREHLGRRLPEHLRSVVTFAGDLDGVDGLPIAGTACVLASGGLGTPAQALASMAAGLVTMAPRSSIGAALIRDSTTGTIFPDNDPAALAETLLASLQDASGRERISEAARRFAAEAAAPEQHAARLLDAYRSVQLPRTSDRRRAKPRVSAVVPVHNRTAFLPDAIRSLRQGGLLDLEIVIVDDGSTDTTVRPLLRDLDGVLLVEQGHRGLAAARNAGIARASGEYVLVMDDDDLVEPGFLLAASRSLTRCPDLAFVSGNTRYFGLLDFVLSPIGALGPLDLVLHTTLRSMVLFRRDCLEAVGGYDEDLPAFEDWDIQIRLAFAGYECDVLPVVGQHYRRHETSMSFSASNAMRCELVQYLVRNHASKLTPEQLSRLLQNVVSFWKDLYEPSQSVLLQRQQPP